MSLLTGLCSITFRSLGVDEVIALAVRSGAEAIEWGSDVHLPIDDLDAATAIGRRSTDAGLAVVSYGTYLGVGAAHDASLAERARSFETAVALGAPMVRVWTELGVTAASPATDRQRVTEQTAAIAGHAAEHGLSVALEFHPGTLTETAASTNALLDALDRPNLRTHWQPDPSHSTATSLQECAAVAGRLAHVHAFTWGPAGIEDRRPLADGQALWPGALMIAGAAPGLDHGPRAVLCEYVRDDDPDQFVADVTALRNWLDR